MTFLDTDQTPTRTRIMENLSHPHLTGMSREDLDALASRAAAAASSLRRSTTKNASSSPRESPTSVP